LCLLSGTLLNAQNVITDSSTTIIGYWDKGDVFNFNLSQKKESLKNNKIVSTERSGSKVRLTVAEAGTDFYILNWQYISIVPDETQAIDSFMLTLLKTTESIDFKYKTSELGEFIELINWEEVRNAGLKILDDLTEEEKKDKNFLSILAEIKKVFSTKESIEQLIARDVQLLHNVFGGEYILNKKIIAPAELPNFLGGNPFPAVLTLEMTKLNPVNKSCHINFNQVLNEEKVTEELNAWAEKAGKPKDSKIPTIKISDDYNFEVDLKKGMIKKASSKRIVIIDDRSNIEEHELTLID